MSTNCKFYKEEEYVSYDSGITWTAMGVYRKGDLIEYDSEDCGYVPPTPTGNTKFSATYSGGETYSVDCDGDTTLTSATTKPSGYQYTAMTTAWIGDCVTSIDGRAFYRCSGLTSIDIPNNVISIGARAFYQCRGLTSCTIGSGVTSIGTYAFYQCTSLTSIVIPNSTTEIGNYAFYVCSGLTSVTVEATTPPTLGSDVFQDTNNCPIYVPCASVSAYKAATNWSTYADRIQGIPPCSEPTPTGGTKFYATYSGGETYSAACDGNTTLTTATTKPSGYEASAMTEAIVGDCVTSIDDYAFRDFSGLTSVTIPSGITHLGTHSFENCYNLKRINSNVDGVFNIPSGVTSFGGQSWTFGDCKKLVSINIPDGITQLGVGAGGTIARSGIFDGCTSLTSITIPSGVTVIGDCAFNGCTALTSITCLAETPPSLSSSALKKTTCPIYVPASSVTAYQSAWSNYASRIQAIP